MLGVPNDFVNILTNSTTVIGTAGAGCNLFRVVINTVGAAANTLKIYAGQSAAAGRLIGTFDTTAAARPGFDFGGLHSKDGFTFVVATGTAADITVLFD